MQQLPGPSQVLHLATVARRPYSQVLTEGAKARQLPDFEPILPPCTAEPEMPRTICQFRTCWVLGLSTAYTARGVICIRRGQAGDWAADCLEVAGPQKKMPRTLSLRYRGWPRSLADRYVHSNGLRQQGDSECSGGCGPPSGLAGARIVGAGKRL